MKQLIDEELIPALEGAIPAVITTASADGIPNVTYVWQVFYVDESHVALSRQFLNKTLQNVSENNTARVLVTSPVTHLLYKLSLRFIEAQTEGPVFNKMALQIAVIAGMQGSADVFPLQSADIYEVLHVERLALV